MSRYGEIVQNYNFGVEIEFFGQKWVKNKLSFRWSPAPTRPMYEKADVLKVKEQRGKNSYFFGQK